MSRTKLHSSDDDLPMFARSLLGGKKNSEVKARITDESKMKLQQRCHELGVTESDYVCRIIDVSLYGLDHVESVERERMRQVVGMFPNGGRSVSTGGGA